MTTLERSPQLDLLPMESPSMQSAEASPARTSPLRAVERGLPESAAVYGPNTPELLANYDPVTSSWRTSQRCLVEGLEQFSETWPRSGTMRNGTAYQLPPLVRLTDETGFGLLPTPNKGMQKHSTKSAYWNKRVTAGRQRDLQMVIYEETSSGSLNPPWVEWLMGFPQGHTDLAA